MVAVGKVHSLKLLLIVIYNKLNVSINFGLKIIYNWDIDFHTRVFFFLFSDDLVVTDSSFNCFTVRYVVFFVSKKCR